MIAKVGSKIHVICLKRFIDKKDIEKRKKDLENDSEYDKTRKNKRLSIGTTSVLTMNIIIETIAYFVIMLFSLQLQNNQNIVWNVRQNIRLY